MLKFCLALLMCKWTFMLVRFLFDRKRWIDITEGISNGIITFVFSYKAFSNLVVSIILFVIMSVMIWISAEMVNTMSEDSK